MSDVKNNAEFWYEPSLSFQNIIKEQRLILDSEKSILEKWLNQFCCSSHTLRKGNLRAKVDVISPNCQEKND